jgi:hypothetical protein
MAIAFETKEQLPVSDSFNAGCPVAKRRIQISLEQIVGLAHMTIDIDNS